MSRRKLQDVYDELRDCDAVIKEGKEAKKRKQEVIKELKNLQINLVKQKKIQWVNKTFQEWFECCKDDEDFWIHGTDCGNTYGIWQGLRSLSDEDLKHWEDYHHDYFYYGYPLYRDQNDSELSECQLHFEGDGSLTKITQDQLYGY